jgi:SAM-dependent methyltransferase
MALSKDQIIAGRTKIIATYGPWTAHDINLGHGVSTLDQGLSTQWRVNFVDQLIKQYSPRFRYRGSRILDLACLEGLFAIEFARLGAETVGIEIRDTHLAKANFARDVIGLPNCRFVQGDVRKIPNELGKFNVVICAGILYHLDFPDCVVFLRDIARRSTDLVIIDSHFAYDHIDTSVFALSEMRSYQFDGHKFRGRNFREHAAQETAVEKAGRPWASIDNDNAVWLDERDVVSIMRESGFILGTRRFPSEYYQQQNPDRPTLVFVRNRMSF